MRLPRAAGRLTCVTGVTVFELIVALTLGSVVIAAAVRYVITELRVLAANEIRNEVTRNARYISISLRRDLQRAGVGIESTPSFGTVDTWPGLHGDTLVVLHVPYLPQQAPPHLLVPPAGNDNPLPPGGTCGSQCMVVERGTTPEFDLEVGSLGRLQVLASRRLVLIDAIEDAGPATVELRFVDLPALLRQPSGLSGVSLDRYASFVQRLQPSIYYLDENDRLIRAIRLDLDGSKSGEVLAYGVELLDVKLLFADGDLHEQVSTTDLDDSNDYDDVIAVRVRVTLRAGRTHPMVNGGELLRRTYEWTIAPRNLRYEKDRL